MRRSKLFFIKWSSRPIRDSRFSRSFAGKPSSLHVLRLLAFVPRIVVVGKGHTVANRRMVGIPEDDKITRVRVRQRQLAQDLERMGARLLGVCIDAVCDLQSVDVSIVLQLSAESAVNRLRN